MKAIQHIIIPFTIPKLIFICDQTIPRMAKCKVNQFQLVLRNLESRARWENNKILAFELFKDTQNDRGKPKCVRLTAVV
jgi:hypothetical protein